jgi:hypothetical protein
MDLTGALKLMWCRGVPRRKEEKIARPSIKQRSDASEA